jgi:hypothetical protein
VLHVSLAGEVSEFMAFDKIVPTGVAVAGDGCATCDAMEGLYEAEPARPHRYCRCIISWTDTGDTSLTAPASGKPSGTDRVGDRWSWSWDDPEQIVYNSDEDGDNYGETYTFKGLLTVECCDESVTGEDYDLVIHVDLSRAATREEADELLEEAIQEAEADMAERARELHDADCDPCSEIV